MASSRILVVDDDAHVRRTLHVALHANGYDVEEVGTGQAAIDRTALDPADLVILDLGLPDVDGVEVCRQIRRWTDLPIIVLSAAGDDAAKVQALDEGADDYVTKPFSIPELLARMRARLRSGKEDDDQVIRAQDVVVDLVRRVVTRADAEVHLTPTEFAILRFLALHAGRVVTHDVLLRSVMGPGYENSRGELRVYIAALRKKLEADPARPRLLLSEMGVGYRLRAD